MNNCNVSINKEQNEVLICLQLDQKRAGKVEQKDKQNTSYLTSVAE